VSLTESLYEATLAVCQPAARVAGLVHGGAGRAVAGREASLERFRRWGETERRSDRPLVWFHAPSVGEALMAQAIIAALRATRPDVQIAFTHFSPSAERMVDEVGADVHGYVPFDTRGPVRRALGALRPAAIAFVRTEVWPVLTREAAQAGARQLLVNAVLSEGSGRLRWLGRSFLEAAYRRLDAVGAVSDDHAARYERLGVPSGRIHTTGDARFDQVWGRIEARGLYGLRGRSDAEARVPPELRALWRRLDDPDRFTLVAGSTWPEDEAVLVPALDAARGARPVRLVIAPHEPTPDHLDALEERLAGAGLDHARLTAVETASGTAPAVVVVDRLGVLADLYALADAAYVGGGFGSRGLHSVVEPAALGVPVVFGPHHGNAREAAALADAGGGFVVADGPALEDRLRTLIHQPDRAAEAGEKAREYVRSETGAAERNADLIAAGL
jgi:3-deoxy-D-manno-octulosonic-acid transferase